MFEHLLKVRYVAIVIVFLAVLHAMAFLVLGAKLAFVAYGHILFGVQTGEARPEHEAQASVYARALASLFAITDVDVRVVYPQDPVPATQDV